MPRAVAPMVEAMSETKIQVATQAKQVHTWWTGISDSAQQIQQNNSQTYGLVTVAVGAAAVAAGNGNGNWSPWIALCKI